jgi:hypothetical protein
MKTKLLFTALCLTFFTNINAQKLTEKAPEPNQSEAVSKQQPKDEDKSANQIQTTNGYVRPTARQRFKRYAKSMFGPYALGSNVVKAGYSTATNSPEEWGGTWEGFGRRFASGMGKSVIKNTTMYGLDEGFKLDSHFYRSQKRDTKSKIKNALISPFTARNRNGKRVIGFPRIAGTYTAGIVAAETWYPSRYDYKNGLRSGTISLGFNAAVNLFKEFVWKK